MLNKLLTNVGHYIVGLAGIGALAGLTATGTVSSSVAVPGIIGIVSALIGGGIATSKPPAA